MGPSPGLKLPPGAMVGKKAARPKAKGKAKAKAKKVVKDGAAVKQRARRAALKVASATGLSARAKKINDWLDRHLEPSVPRLPTECKYRHSGITVGSACSGWCSELFALESMKVPFTSCFCCDTDPHVATLLPHLHDHHLFISDVTSDDFFNRAPNVDFFMAGFPCQSFSPAGQGRGARDPRGSIVFFIIRWLELRRPRCFLLENVEGLYTRHPNVLLLILEMLGAKNLYKVSWKVLNARKHSGLPQNRSRLFIAGVRADAERSQMKWPGEAPALSGSGLALGALKQAQLARFERKLCCLVSKRQRSTQISDLIVCQVPMRNIDEFIGLSGDPRRDDPPSLNWPGRLPSGKTERGNVRFVLEKLKAEGIDGLKSRHIVDIGGSRDRVAYMEGVSPCLTRARASSGGHWLTWKQRKMTPAEVLALQGVSLGRLPEGVLSDRQLGAIAGNAVPVPLLARVLKALFLAAGLLS